jgi:AcrR family transcriptional regulator
MQEQTTPAAPPGRGENARRAVLAATVAELTEVGYAALTVEHVAARAGVHKTTVYRRWPDRERLVVDAVSGHLAEDIEIPDTGSIERDLQTLARALVTFYVGTVGRSLLAATFTDAMRIPEIAAVRQQVFTDRLRRAAPVVQRAIARGELPADTDAHAVIEALVAPIYLRLLVTGERLDRGTADRAAALALAGARSGVLSTRVAMRRARASAPKTG